MPATKMESDGQEESRGQGIPATQLAHPLTRKVHQQFGSFLRSTKLANSVDAANDITTAKPTTIVVSSPSSSKRTSSRRASGRRYSSSTKRPSVSMTASGGSEASSGATSKRASGLFTSAPTTGTTTTTAASPMLLGFLPPPAYVRPMAHSPRTPVDLLPPPIAPHPLSRAAHNFPLSPSRHLIDLQKTPPPTPPTQVRLDGDGLSPAQGAAKSSQRTTFRSPRMGIFIESNNEVDGVGSEPLTAGELALSRLGVAHLFDLAGVGNTAKSLNAPVSYVPTSIGSDDMTGLPPSRRTKQSAASRTQQLQTELFTMVAPLQHSSTGLTAEAMAQMKKLAKALKSTTHPGLRVFPHSLRELAQQQPMTSFENTTQSLLDLLKPHVAKPIAERILEQERRTKPWKFAPAFNRSKNALAEELKQAEKHVAELGLDIIPLASVEESRERGLSPARLAALTDLKPSFETEPSGSHSLSLFRAPPVHKWPYKEPSVQENDAHRIRFQSVDTARERTPKRVERPESQLRQVDQSEMEEIPGPEADARRREQLMQEQLEAKVKESFVRSDSDATHSATSSSLQPWSADDAGGSDAPSTSQPTFLPSPPPPALVAAIPTQIRRQIHGQFLVDDVPPTTLLKAGLVDLEDASVDGNVIALPEATELAEPINPQDQLPFPSRSGSRHGLTTRSRSTSPSRISREHLAAAPSAVSPPAAESIIFQNRLSAYSPPRRGTSNSPSRPSGRGGVLTPNGGIDHFPLSPSAAAQHGPDQSPSPASTTPNTPLQPQTAHSRSGSQPSRISSSTVAPPRSEGFLSALLEEIMPDIQKWKQQQRIEERKRKAREEREHKRGHHHHHHHHSREEMKEDSEMKTVEELNTDSSIFSSDHSANDRAFEREQAQLALRQLITNAHSEPISNRAQPDILTIHHPDEATNEKPSTATLTITTPTVSSSSDGVIRSSIISATIQPQESKTNDATVPVPQDPISVSTAVILPPPIKSKKKKVHQRSNSLSISSGSQTEATVATLAPTSPSQQPQSPSTQPPPHSRTISLLNVPGKTDVTARIAASVDAIHRRRTATNESKAALLNMDFKSHTTKDLTQAKEMMKREEEEANQTQCANEYEAKEQADGNSSLTFDDLSSSRSLSSSHDSISANALTSSSSSATLSHNPSAVQLQHSLTHSLVTPFNKSKLISLLTRMDGTGNLSGLSSPTGSQSARVSSTRMVLPSSNPGFTRTYAPVTATDIQSARSVRFVTPRPPSQHQLRPQSTGLFPSIYPSSQEQKESYSSSKKNSNPTSSSDEQSFQAIINDAVSNHHRTLLVIRHLQSALATIDLSSSPSHASAAPNQLMQRRRPKLEKALAHEMKQMDERRKKALEAIEKWCAQHGPEARWSNKQEQILKMLKQQPPPLSPPMIIIPP